jgi:hypothetical protein
VFKENVSELELEIINLQTVIIENKSEWHRLTEFSAVCTVSYSNTSVIKCECMFWFYLLKQIRVFNNENTKVKVQIIINW